MSKFLEVTVRIPIREEHQDNPAMHRRIAGACEVAEIPKLPDSMELSLNSEAFQDSVLITSLAHVKAAVVVDIDPIKGYMS